VLTDMTTDMTSDLASDLIAPETAPAIAIFDARVDALDHYVGGLVARGRSDRLAPP
jgi:hypothetical protein